MGRMMVMRKTRKVMSEMPRDSAKKRTALSCHSSVSAAASWPASRNTARAPTARSSCWSGVA